MKRLLALMILGAGADLIHNAPSPDAIAEAVLASSSSKEAIERLADVGVEGTSHALQPLFKAAVSKGENDSYWSALCKLDTWRDGAWWAEVMGAACDATDGHLEIFAKRYLDGDDCALLLLLYGVGWPEAITSLGGPECSPDSQASLREFDARLATFRNLLYKVEGSPGQQVRKDILHIAVGDALSGWELIKLQHAAACDR